jgi:hypothetical protein
MIHLIDKSDNFILLCYSGRYRSVSYTINTLQLYYILLVVETFSLQVESMHMHREQYWTLQYVALLKTGIWILK